MAVLRADKLVKVYSKRPVVNEVSLQVGTGEVVGLLGPNGAGKTQTFYQIVGLVRPDAGTVLLNDDDITRLPMYRRARKGIAYLPQEPSIFRKMTVAENVLAVLETLDIPKDERHRRKDSLLAELHISHLEKHRAYTLSGGERRRTEIARTLAISPSFILLDEPFAGIDPRAIDDIQQIIRQLRQRGIGVVISDHNAAEILNIADRAYLIVDGRILMEGTPDDLKNSEDARQLYFGDMFVQEARTSP